MGSSRSREITAGAILLVAGLFFVLYALATLGLGSFAKMGPGMFPVLIGAALGLIGGAQIVVALRPVTAREVEPVEWRALAVVATAMFAFAAVIGWFGLIPAIFAMVLIAQLASHRITLRASVLLAAGLAIAAWVIFVKALGLPFRMFEWPF
jgi:hypothetical protein